MLSSILVAYPEIVLGVFRAEAWGYMRSHGETPAKSSACSLRWGGLGIWGECCVPVPSPSSALPLDLCTALFFLSRSQLVSHFL